RRDMQPAPTTETALKQAKERSPLTDSNRRPPPYHRWAVHDAFGLVEDVHAASSSVSTVGWEISPSAETELKNGLVAHRYTDESPVHQPLCLLKRLQTWAGGTDQTRLQHCVRHDEARS